MAFRGHYEHSLDAKNRLNVPARFRATFSSGLVLARGIEPCVEMWTPDAFDAYMDSFMPDMSPLSQRRRDLAKHFGSGSSEVELDSAGRVMLEARLRQHAGITKEVSVIGVLDHVEVWDRAAWLAKQEQLSAEIAEIAEGGVGHPS